MVCGGGFGGVDGIGGASENPPKEGWGLPNGLDAGAAGTLKAEVPLTFGGGWVGLSAGIDGSFGLGVENDARGMDGIADFGGGLWATVFGVRG
jgi:hypothetical protein